MPIRILPPELASQIAAGEVVERPASVVRELLDNALDAGADRVRVEVERGGTKSVVVTDNGCGMNPDDAALSVERHSTSKIATLDDLQRIVTLGFRGEALASIASVSRLTIETREAASPAGTRVSVTGGLDQRVEETGAPVGTTVRVEDLFFNVPARRKFLRAESTEFRHVTDSVVRAALGWEKVQFQLAHHRRGMLDFPRAESRFDRVAAVLGRAAADRLLPVLAESGGMVLEGFVATPAEHRRAADQVYFILNGRYISNRMLLSALLRAFERALPPRRYPVAVLYLQTNPRDVDVNVHPTKLEVKFANESRVFSLVSGAVRHTLETTSGLAVTVPPAGGTPSVASTPPAAESGPPSPSAAPPDAASKPPEPSPPIEGPPSVESDLRPRSPEPPPADDRRERVREKVEEFVRRGGWPAGPFRPPRHPDAPATREPAALPSPFPEPELLPRRPALRALAQILDAYLLCEDGAGLVIVDMHAAHERLRYEELKRAAAGQAASQSLLFPHRVDFSVTDAQVVDENLDLFRRLGFDLEPFGGGSFLVSRIPAVLRTGQVEPILRDLAADLRERGAADSLEALTEKLLVTLACHHVLRSGDRVEPAEMQALVDRLLACPNPDTCPHGRPVWLRFSSSDLARLFKRTGFA